MRQSQIECQVLIRDFFNSERNIVMDISYPKYARHQTKITSEGGTDLIQGSEQFFSENFTLFFSKSLPKYSYIYNLVLKFRGVTSLLSSPVPPSLLMGTTISQSFVKIGSKTKNFYYQDIFCKQTADTLFQLSQKPLSQFCSKFQRMFL